MQNIQRERETDESCDLTYEHACIHNIDKIVPQSTINKLVEYAIFLVTNNALT